jgi:2-dehydropantoate 2-reductase
MIVLIYGAGAVGLGVASCLLKSGARVDIVGRADTVSLLREGGLVRTGIFGDYRAGPGTFGSYTSLKDLGGKVYDYILVCTKSFDSAQAAKDLSEHKSLLGEKTPNMGPSGRIVLFQNGWGNAEVFLSFFDKSRVYNARVITGFHRPRKNEVVITVHADAIHIGSLFGSDLLCIEPLCESITKGQIPCETTSEIGKDLWAKMLYNCALNPLGAVLDVPYGELARHESGRIIMKGIVEEVFEIMAAAGYQTHWQCPADFLEVFYEKLVPDTARHRSSTLQDIKAKKRTEIDALNGAVIRLAERCGVDAPYNTVVYSMVKFLAPAPSLARAKGDSLST